MATITSLGVGSGLDLQSMLDKLVSLERQPLVQMKADAGKLQNQVSVWGKVNGLFSTLKDASNALTNATLWSRTQASSASESAVGAVGGENAAAGVYAVKVDRLAARQTLASGTAFTAATAKPGAGTLTLERGRWDADTGAFSAAAGGEPVQITVTDGDTLTTLRDKINAAGAGVTASLVSDAAGVRLALRSVDSGAENAFRVQAVAAGPGDGDGDLSRLGYDPEAGATGLQLKETAANALASVNGIAVESASNELTGVVEGLTLRLRQVGPDAVPVTVTRDKDAVTKAVKAFVEAYNGVASYIAEQTKFDAASKVGGPLQGDATANGLVSQLRAVLNTPSTASSVFGRLSDMGLTLQRNGTMSIDEAKLSAAADNPAELKKAFAGSSTTDPAGNGFARRYATLASGVLATDGALATRTDGLRTRIQRNEDDQQKLQDRVERFQARLAAQYTAMDASLSRLNGLQSYVTQQLQMLNKSSN